MERAGFQPRANTGELTWSLWCFTPQAEASFQPTFTSQGRECNYAFIHIPAEPCSHPNTKSRRRRRRRRRRGRRRRRKWVSVTNACLLEDTNNLRTLGDRRGAINNVRCGCRQYVSWGSHRGAERWLWTMTAVHTKSAIQCKVYLVR